MKKLRRRAARVLKAQQEAALGELRAATQRHRQQLQNVKAGFEVSAACLCVLRAPSHTPITACG